MVKLIALVARKPGLTHEQFRDHYENVHVPLIMKLLPFAIDYRRNYIEESRLYTNPFATNISSTSPFDVVTEVLYPDMAALELMQHASARPHIGDQIAADEELFVDRARTVMFIADERITNIARAGGVDEVEV